MIFVFRTASFWLGGDLALRREVSAARRMLAGSDATVQGYILAERKAG
jgi:hypothetical protein